MGERGDGLEREGTVRRRTNKSKIKRFIALVVAVYLVAMFARGFIWQGQRMQEQGAEQVVFAQKIEEITAQNDELARKIEYADTHAFAEQYSRDYLGLVGKGEIKFQLEGDE